MSTAPKTIAVTGGTGELGQHIVRALIALQPTFEQIVVLVRDAKSPKCKEFKDAGAVIREYNEDNLDDTFSDVDVLINAINGAYPFKKAIAKAIESPSCPVKLYIPSEFGIDHYDRGSVACVDHVEWREKKAHHKLLECSTKVHTCRVYTGLFMELSIGPWFGFNTKEGKYEAIGSADAPISFTSLADVGRAVSVICTLRLDHVPVDMHLSGDVKTMNEIKEIMEKAGAGEIKIEVKDQEQYKEILQHKESKDPARHLMLLMGASRINHTEDGLGTSNDLVNPGERMWKWKTIEDYAKETKGKPWADY